MNENDMKRSGSVVADVCNANIEIYIKPGLAAYILETPVILWHKGLTFECTNKVL